MKTNKKYLDLRESKEYIKIKEASDIIKKGGLVLFPTETVYGIGANGLDEEAVKNIFRAKGRKQDNPLILHISNMDMLIKIAQNISELEYKLMNEFWPGPFTLILNRTKIVPDVVTSGLDTVGIRMPSGEIAKKLIEYAKVPIAAPSANISGRPSGTNVEDIFEELEDKVDYIIDGGQCKIGVESTVVRVIDGVPHILRPGKITANEIKKIAGVVVMDKNIMGIHKLNEKVLSPGMKYRHYAPNSKCILVYSKDNEKMVLKINEIAKEYKNPLIVSSTKNVGKYKIKNIKNITNVVEIIDMGEELEEITKNIFTILRKVDTYNPNIVLIEGVNQEGIGHALMNRLIRACEHNYVEV